MAQIDWKDKNNAEWKKYATDEQTKFHNTLGSRTWEKYTKDDTLHIEIKIGYALYGPPEKVDESHELKLYYSEDQKKQIHQLLQQILELSKNDDDIHIAFIILPIKHDNDIHHYQLPLIRVQKSQEQHRCHYVDYLGRVYDGWKDFLDSNKLPKGIFCYPLNGFYESDGNGLPLLGFATPPASDSTHKFFAVADTAAVVGTVISIVASIVSFLFPITAPILIPVATYTGIAAGGYGIARGTEELVDRAEHDQSISLSDPEARAAWFSIVGGLFGVSSIGVLKYTQFLAKSGNIASKALRISYTILESGSLTVNGLDMIFQVSYLVDRAKKHELTTLDVFRFLISTFFFTHSLIHFKLASTIIKEVQSNVIDSYEKTLPAEHQIAFKELCENTRADSGTMHGNATTIKGIKRITNTNEFFHNLILANEEGQTYNSSVVFTEKGIIKINNELNIHPMKFAEIAGDTRAMIFEYTKKLQAEPEYVNQFEKDIEKICRTERIRFEVQRKKAVSIMSEKLDVKNLNEFKLNGKRIFKDLEPFQIDRLDSVMINSCNKYNKELLQLVQEFAAQNEAANVTDFCSLTEYAHKFILDNRDTSIPKKQRFQAAIDELKDPSSGKMPKLNEQYRAMKLEVSKENVAASPLQFVNDTAATYHFYKHGTIGTTEVNPQEYFEMMQDLFSSPGNELNSVLSQEGNVKFITFVDSTTGVKGIKIERAINNKEFAVFVATFYYDKKLLRKN